MNEDTKIAVYSRNDLPERVRMEVAALLQDRLADCIDLKLQAKQAHWNVKGPNFIALHELFDEIAEETEAYVDLIAERIVQFGGVAEGTVRAVAARSSMPEYPLATIHWHKHVEELSHALAYFGELARQAIERATKLADADTADIFTEISRGIDKYLWMVEAHLQEG
ncbi:DNA starvation/stationary phase protection protein Dps [Flavobacterium sp.]|uniref:DNA starvation/stationary phase protection protein Dps n=1 Tax=Flavobacterium sp. TaxID=239 RepID=UPI0025E4CC72|nr:DNA starvation/stationary phase protection protein Dps [Flavobacterium sp.]